MTPQADRPTTGDDWWERLYGDQAPDAAPGATDDTLDDRYDSVSGALAPPPEPPPPGPPPAGPPNSRSGAPPRAPDPGELRPGPDPRAFPDAPRPARPAPGPATEPSAPVPEAPAPAAAVPHPRATAHPRSAAPHTGDGPPPYDPEPTALPPTRPGEPADPVPDTVLDGARYGTFTLRAASTRGDSARLRGEPRREALLTARFGTGEDLLVVVAVATGARTGGEAAHRAAGDACRWLGEAVGRGHERLARDIAAGRRQDLRSGLHRLTGRTYGRLRARAAERGVDPGAYTADLRCLLLSGDPGCRTRIFFGVGEGGLFRLRDGVWQDLEPPLPEPVPDAAPAVPPPPHGRAGEAGPDRAGAPPHPGGRSAGEPPAVPFRFRVAVARPGDTLLLTGGGLAAPLRYEPALGRELAERWGSREAPPGLAAFLADTRLGAEGCADDRTAAAVWEA
ncbi:protein phosphatase 2C domain-containing protein [Streptomyces somaliensis]|nr:protein phosphatase 2C domain-containing protein [Streptomyces somaliensis]